MQNKTVKVRDGADCRMSVREGPEFKGLNYTIYHGDDSSIQIAQGDTIFDRTEDPFGASITDDMNVVNFKRLRECYI